MFFPSFPLTIGFLWKNVAHRLGDNQSEIFCGQNQPLLTFDFSRSIIPQVELDHIKANYEALKGKKEVFRFKDPSDFVATDYVKETGLGTSTQGVALSEDGTNFQLFKKYTCAGVSVYRPITRPVELFSISGTSSYTINWETGRLSFGSTQPLELSWSGYFDVPVRLDLDPTSTTETDKLSYAISNFKLIEVRERSLLWGNIEFTASLDIDYQLFSEVGEQQTEEIGTIIDRFDSSWERRDNFSENSVTRYSLGERKKNSQKEIDYFIALWRVSRGGATAFRYQDTLVSGRADASIIAESPGNFTISSFELVGVSNLLAIDSETYVKAYIDNSGSMSSSIPTVIEAISDLRSLVRDLVFSGDEVLTDKYYKGYALLGGEEWLNWANEDIRDSPSDPNKQLKLIWCNESSPVYHGWESTPVTEPTSVYLSHHSSFISSWADRLGFSCFLYSITTTDAAFDEFQAHLDKAYYGSDGYPAGLVDYNFNFYKDIPASSPPSFYYKDIVGASVNPKTLCRCWKIRLLDDTELGFTDFDEPLTFGGLTYYPFYGGTSSAREFSNDGSVGNTQAEFILSSEAITESDLLGGKYDEAYVTTYVVNWSFLSDIVTISVGKLGKIEISKGRLEGRTWKGEIRDNLSFLKQKSNEQMTKECSKTFGELGPGLCNFDLLGSGLIDSIAVTEVIDRVTFKTDSIRILSNYYGTITFTTGSNDGYSRLVADYDGGTKTITLWQSLPNPISVGDVLQAKPRCEKTKDACHGYQGHLLNYGGFDVPGNDQLRKSDRL